MSEKPNTSPTVSKQNGTPQAPQPSVAPAGFGPDLAALRADLRAEFAKVAEYNRVSPQLMQLFFGRLDAVIAQYSPAPAVTENTQTHGSHIGF